MLIGIFSGIFIRLSPGPSFPSVSLDLLLCYHILSTCEIISLAMYLSIYPSISLYLHLSVPFDLISIFTHRSIQLSTFQAQLPNQIIINRDFFLHKKLSLGYFDHPPHKLNYSLNPDTAKLIFL